MTVERVSFVRKTVREFTRKGVIVTAVTIAVAAPFLWLRYFVAG